MAFELVTVNAVFLKTCQRGLLKKYKLQSINLRLDVFVRRAKISGIACDLDVRRMAQNTNLIPKYWEKTIGEDEWCSKACDMQLACNAGNYEVE